MITPFLTCIYKSLNNSVFQKNEVGLIFPFEFFSTLFSNVRMGKGEPPAGTWGVRNAVPSHFGLLPYVMGQFSTQGYLSQLLQSMATLGKSAFLFGRYRCVTQEVIRNYMWLYVLLILPSHLNNISHVTKFLVKSFLKLYYNLLLLFPYCFSLL